MVAELLAGMHIADMQLDQANARAFDGVMQGQVFEEMIGFPSGASLRIAFLAGPDKAPARVEIMSFDGVERSENIKENIGIRRIVMNTADLAQTLAKFVELECRIISENVIEGPAGIEVELRESG